MVRLAVTRMLAGAPMWPLRSVPHNDAEAACRARARSPPHCTYHGTQVPEVHGKLAIVSNKTPIWVRSVTGWLELQATGLIAKISFGRPHAPPLRR